MTKNLHCILENSFYVTSSILGVTMNPSFFGRGKDWKRITKGKGFCQTTRSSSFSPLFYSPGTDVLTLHFNWHKLSQGPLGITFETHYFKTISALFFHLFKARAQFFSASFQLHMSHSKLLLSLFLVCSQIDLSHIPTTSCLAFNYFSGRFQILLSYFWIASQLLLSLVSNSHLISC